MFTKPTPNSEVTVTVRNNKRSFWHTDNFEDVKYAGTVIADNAWTTPAEFVLLTPSTPEYPKRTIQLKSVTDMQFADGSVAQTKQADDNFKQWTVDGSKPGTKYLVIKAGTKWTCDCVAFQFKKTCKHINKLMEENK